MTELFSVKIIIFQSRHVFLSRIILLKISEINKTIINLHHPRNNCGGKDFCNNCLGKVDCYIETSDKIYQMACNLIQLLRKIDHYQKQDDPWQTNCRDNFLFPTVLLTIEDQISDISEYLNINSG